MKSILHKGDCFAIMPTLMKKSVDCILTDPPYGCRYQSNMKKNKDMPMFYDRNTAWLNTWLFEAHRVLKDDGHLYMFAPVQKIDEFKQKVENFFIIKNILVWDKGTYGKGDLRGQYAPSYEFIIFAVKEQGRKLYGKRERDVLHFQKSNCKLHPTEKPVELLKFLISKSTDVGDVVLDSFMGSGGTGEACEEMERNFIGIELDDKHFGNAEQRMGKIENNKPIIFKDA